MKSIRTWTFAVLGAAALTLSLGACDSSSGGNDEETIPAAPGAPTLTAGDTELGVSWTAVSGATTYEVWYGTTDVSGDATQFGGDVTGTSTTITGLTNDTLYYVWLKAKNSLGTSAFGPSASATPAPPPPAVNLVANISTMEAEWAANSAYWNHWGGTGRTVVAGTYAGMDGGCWQGTATDFGANPWDVQLAAGKGIPDDYEVRVISLQPGKQYTIRLKGAASASVSIQAILQINGTYDNADQLDIALTPTTQTFADSTPFVPPGPGNTDVKFMFNIGGLPANTILYIDDVELLEEDAP